MLDQKESKYLVLTKSIWFCGNYKESSFRKALFLLENFSSLLECWTLNVLEFYDSTNSIGHPTCNIRLNFLFAGGLKLKVSAPSADQEPQGTNNLMQSKTNISL